VITSLWRRLRRRPVQEATDRADKIIEITRGHRASMITETKASRKAQREMRAAAALAGMATDVQRPWTRREDDGYVG
jgi:hypothetical protein